MSLPSHINSDFKKILKFHTQNLFEKLNARDNMQMMIDYARFNIDQYGKKEKKEKMELVKLIAQNIKIHKDAIPEELDHNSQSDNDD